MNQHGWWALKTIAPPAPFHASKRQLSYAKSPSALRSTVARNAAPSPIVSASSDVLTEGDGVVAAGCSPAAADISQVNVVSCAAEVVASLPAVAVKTASPAKKAARSTKSNKILQDTILKMSSEQIAEFANRLSQHRANLVRFTPDEEEEMANGLLCLLNSSHSFHQENVTQTAADSAALVQPSQITEQSVRMLYRRLYLRILKRKLLMKVFDIDAFMTNYFETTKSVYPYRSTFSKISLGFVKDLPFVMNPSLSFTGKQAGKPLYAWAISQEKQVSTHKTLKHFIRRDYDALPSKLGVLRFFSSEIFPIDYVYLRTDLIEPVNNMLREFFWPRIDISENLNWPSHSVVAMYKKLVVGCAFMTPDPCYITYLLVHPDWEKSTIGSFMLYHLIQVSGSKDITLHVSASNNALILYQKFGFKPEEFVVNFYDKYQDPANTAMSKNAFYLRLKK